MANLILELSVIAREALRLLIPLLEDAGERILVDDHSQGHRRGDTVRVREVRMDANRWDPHSWELTERASPVNLEYYETYAIPFDSRWLTLTVDELCHRYLKPMVRVFAETIRSQWPRGSTLVCANPYLPPPGTNSGGYTRATDPNSRLSILVARDYDIIKNQEILGIGMLFGLINAYQMNWFEEEQVYVLTLARNRLSDRLIQLKRAA